ncbi:MAG: hypothetical protein KGQ77_11275, partial [Betaproteobacteria bacterium]|nr:hypothetical protein [Betaproteobacteria bacterium]
MTRLTTLHSPLGKDLLLQHMTALEGVSRLSRFDLEVLSPKADIEFTDLLGQHLTVELSLPDGCGADGKRFFDGIVSSVSYTGMVG